MTDSTKPRLVGFNHIAIEVGDIEQALDFYGKLFTFELRSREPGMAFIDLGDQFLALQETESPSPTGGRHFGLVVEDKEALRAALAEAGEQVNARGHLRMRDPSGNQIEIVDYRDVQFTKTPAVLRALGVEGISKSERAEKELAEKGLV